MASDLYFSPAIFVGGSEAPLPFHSKQGYEIALIPLIPGLEVSSPIVSANHQNCCLTLRRRLLLGLTLVDVENSAKNLMAFTNLRRWTDCRGSVRFWYMCWADRVRIGKKLMWRQIADVQVTT